MKKQIRYIHTAIDTYTETKKEGGEYLKEDGESGDGCIHIRRWKPRRAARSREKEERESERDWRRRERSETPKTERGRRERGFVCDVGCVRV